MWNLLLHGSSDIDVEMLCKIIFACYILSLLSDLDHVIVKRSVQAWFCITPSITYCCFLDYSDYIRQCAFVIFSYNATCILSEFNLLKEIMHTRLEM